MFLSTNGVSGLKLKKSFILLLILAAVVSSYLTYNFTMLRYQNILGVERHELSELEDFFYVYEYVKEHFVEDISSEKLMEGAISGLLEATEDPYTSYLPASQYQRIMEETDGSFGGVGIYVGIRDDKIVIIAPIEGTPGDKAGLMRGDQITAVDGVETADLTLDEIVDLMRGKIGTVVEVTVLREGEEEPRVFEIRRALIEIETVQFQLLENGIGYIAITEFNRTTAADFQNALNELTKESMRGLVLDLRNNPGGVLSDSVEVAEMLIPPGPVVHIVDRSGSRETRYSETPGIGIPLAVLINDGSASASEVVSGAIKDSGSGILIGTTTFGKASVQGIFGLFNGGGFKITTNRYLTPAGTQINGIGIAPDLEVFDLGDRDLAVGDTGQDVKKLATLLSDLGYTVDDGQLSYNAALAGAVKEFQEDVGLESDGAATRKVLYRVISEWEKEFPDGAMVDPQLDKAVETLLKD